MERKITLSLYITALVISIIIFLVGIFVGTLVDKSIFEGVTGEVSKISDKMAALQLLLLMEDNSSSFCPVYSAELDSMDSEVEAVGYKLSYLEDQKQAFDVDLKKRYFTLEAESYLLSKRVKQLCGDNNILLINFYSNKNCDSCRTQGDEILKAKEYFKAQNITVKLYSFDGELGSPVADAFAKQYGVTKYPSVIINERTYGGYQDFEKLKSAINVTQS